MEFPISNDILLAVCDEPQKYLPSPSSLKERVQNTASWLSWVSSQPSLKVTEVHIPQGVLPIGTTAVLADVRVTSKGPDDAIFDSNKDIRDRVARGNSLLRVQNGEWMCLIHALKKFTGGMGDDDDREGGGDDSIWQRYFTKVVLHVVSETSAVRSRRFLFWLGLSLSFHRFLFIFRKQSMDEVKRVISTRKQNGEAAHLACVKIQGHHYICTGSKNVHLLIGKRSDIKLYTDSRYQVAREVAECVMNMLEEMESAKWKKLLGFLEETRFTAIFEILNPAHQHIEDLSYLDGRTCLKFIAWTSTELGLTSPDQLCTFPPDVGAKVAEFLGLNVTEFEEVNTGEAEGHMTAIRKQYGYEGEVMYFLDAEHNVIGLLKKKTAWYIICRAIREKVKHAAHEWQKGNKATQEVSRTKIKKRISEIQRWLSLDKETTSKWQELGVTFLQWCLNSLSKRTMEVKDIADLFPVTWNKFLRETGCSDKIGVE